MEQWKDVLGFEGHYQVSSKSNVRSLSRWVNYGTQFVNGRILKQKVKTNGYFYVTFSYNGVDKQFSVHRLVAQAFIENPKNKAFVNHINGIKTDNRIENLEWCTPSENNIHAFKILSRKPVRNFGEKAGMWGKRGALSPLSKKCFNVVTGEVFHSIKEAAKSIGMRPCNLSENLSGRRNNSTNIRRL